MKIKGWKKAENDTYIMWSNGLSKYMKIGDIYSTIEFVKPKNNEIGYLYIRKQKVNWSDGLANSAIIVKNIYSATPKTTNEGIKIATQYMVRNHKG